MLRGDKSHSLLGFVVAFTILCTIAIAMRFMSARIQKRSYYADDYLVLIAYFAMIAMGGVSIWGLVNGLGNPATALTFDELVVQAQLLVAASVTWIVSTSIVKIAVLWLYTRIFPNVVFRRVAQVLMGVCTCYGIAFLVVFITRCDPVSQEWKPVAWGSCKDVSQSQLASNSINAVLDMSIVVLPLPSLWNLKMALRRKLSVMAMFSVGFATVAVMWYRIYTTVHGNPDPVLALADVGLLSLLELWLGIIVACMPTVAPVFVTYVQPALSKASESFNWGSKGPSTTDRQDAQVITIGGSGPAGGVVPGAPPGGRKFRTNYTDISLASTTYDDPVDRQSQDILLVSQPGAKIRTHIGAGGGGVPGGGMGGAMPKQEGIYVQQQFHTQGDSV
ncbi:hypothetical protein B0T17DRAFT_615131 [Bombardia bombarda]|uniref:Rhodopsin domain-containing protein n=1 Tax=Bombardia bombarda TaxID=252184 RepID=A0AA40C8X3_9PEZI|nr:hypothetical protein B0T17DRAFT_615131 [Bombardia bombarda]